MSPAELAMLRRIAAGVDLHRIRHRVSKACQLLELRGLIVTTRDAYPALTPAGRAALEESR